MILMGVLKPLFCSLQVFLKLEFIGSEKIISNWYEVQRNLFIYIICGHILTTLGKNAFASSL